MLFLDEIGEQGLDEQAMLFKTVEKRTLSAHGWRPRSAASADARWSGNFRDLSAAVARMATLAEAGRITKAVVDAEVGRLQRLWRTLAPQPAAGIALEDAIGEEAAAQLDLFDRLQLQAVLEVCRQSKSMSDAGRKLFAVSRASKAKPNDADRLRKYLARFDLDWDSVA